ncbi:hypothetical protein CROQUDRAFT_76239 [Cronartium quercuum f. sp. fusiforme G11]|uniref:CNNM transmembrane domain-containing protein n=1 Tax=Cronartium quercuum f. sp. fusiforme G11 TaxID=708437 RepID=A0A9P6NP63_9BASI|nr:hypothetical protein CROQUDRAFT_76239 [Cronartium quercuum f. sp. fusiforme G11]
MVNLPNVTSQLWTGPVSSSALAENAETEEPPIWNHTPSVKKTKTASLWLLSAVLFLLNQSVQAGLTTRAHHPTVIGPSYNGALERRQASNISAPASAHRLHGTGFDIQAALIPVLVLLSGMFAGLTLGYMSLDSTQLCVLARSGTPEQQRLAKKIAPLRKDGHLLLITLLIANMIANETLPVVSDNVLGGGIQAVVISTVLVIIFSEIIPQSVCSTYGLQIGAACAKPVQILVYMLYPICWPIAWLLTKVLGAHSGIIYRRAELKELVSLHTRMGEHGGDLNEDVVTIVGAAIDLQERVVQDVMTPLESCFMLDIETRLDYEVLGRVLASGHSRIPIYEDSVDANGMSRRKILGALLTKQLILIDPEDAVPLRDFPLNPLPLVADNMPLLNILNSFQEGRSHLAIVCPRPHKVAFAPFPATTLNPSPESQPESVKSLRAFFCFPRKPSKPAAPAPQPVPTEPVVCEKTNSAFWPLQADQPLGIITLEDVIEELLGEQIRDETDADECGNMAVYPYVPPEAAEAMRKSSSRTDSSAVLIAEKPEKSISMENNAHMHWSLGTFRLASKPADVQAPTRAVLRESVSSDAHRLTVQSKLAQPQPSLTVLSEDKLTHEAGIMPAPLGAMGENVPTYAAGTVLAVGVDRSCYETGFVVPPSTLSALEDRNVSEDRPQYGPHDLRPSLSGSRLAGALSIERGRRALVRGASSNSGTTCQAFKGPATSMPMPARNSRRISCETSPAKERAPSPENKHNTGLSHE